MPERTEINHLLTLKDRTGSEVKVFETVETKWKKGLKVTSHGAGDQGLNHWPSPFYIKGPEEKAEVVHWLRVTTDMFEPELPRPLKTAIMYYPEGKHLKELKLAIYRDKDSINFCWRAYLEPATIYKLADFIENWEPVFC